MTIKAVRSLLDHYKRGPLQHCVKSVRPAGGSANLIMAAQPSGDWSDFPTSDLILIETVTPGVHHKSNFGAGFFEERTPAGALFLIPPQTATQIEVRCDHTIRAVAIDARFAQANLAQENASLDFGHLHFGHFRNETVQSLARALWHGIAPDSGTGRLHAETLLSIMLAELALQASMPRPIAKGGLAAWQVRRVTEAIAECRADSLSLNEMAELVELSVFHFVRAFRASLGMPPHRYQMLLRINRARALLENSTSSVTEIAHAVGYDSSQALARCFRQQTGCSPSEYRRQHRS